jgi:methylglutaconyl-CoA hydratase
VLRSETLGPVTRLTLNRPERHNALNAELINQLNTAFAEQAGRVVVLSANGTSFCAGADLLWMRDAVAFSEAENRADAQALATVLLAIAEGPRPVIARVQGPAYGGGVGLVAACDLTGALSSAVFCLSEVRLGLIPAVISPFLIRRLGLQRAKRLTLTAERLDAQMALTLGLIDAVFDTEAELDAWVEGQTQALLKAGPQALAESKTLFARPCSVAETVEAIARVRVSAEGQEGVRAFLEKRSPSWWPQIET